MNLMETSHRCRHDSLCRVGPGEKSLETFDPYTPAEMAGRVEAGGVAKAALDLPRTLALAVLAGAFIGLGAMISTVAGTGTSFGYGPSRLLAGLAFCLGLVLVLVGGAELFTGNALIVMAWAERRVKSRALLRNWTIVYAGNFIGAAATALGIYLSGIHRLGSGAVAESALAIARAKLSLDFGEAFFRGVFCNALVCLAVWLGFSARTTTDKILCIVFPITAFVAAGFEHSIANMYFVPMGMLLSGEAGFDLTWSRFLLGNLLPVTLGNVAGGSLMVGLAYWFIYLRKE
jgi:formate/nitrite transporter